MQDEVDSLLKSNKKLNEAIDELKEKLNEISNKYNDEQKLFEQWPSEKEDLVQQKVSFSTAKLARKF